MRHLYKLIFTLSIATITSHAASTKTVKYVIKKGESLSAIAKKNHLSIQALCTANGFTEDIADIVLKAGQVIKLPAKRSSAKHSSIAAKETQKKPMHSAKKQERRLAKVLVRLNSKTAAKVHIKKVKKFTLSDIVFDKSSFDGKMSKTSKRIIELAKQKLGKRYVWGAMGQHNTFDCSGLTSYVCKKNGICLPRRAIQQSKYGKPIKRNELQPGDLVFFDTSKQRKGYVNHVGIYIGNGKFIHASSAKKKVIITSLSKPIYSQRFKGARRVASL